MDTTLMMEAQKTLLTNVYSNAHSIMYFAQLIQELVNYYNVDQIPNK